MVRPRSAVLLAALAPGVAEAAICTATTSLELQVCFTGAKDGDEIHLANNTVFQRDGGFSIDDDVLIRPVTLGGTKPTIQSTDSSLDGHSLFVGSVIATAKVTISEIKIDNLDDDDKGFSELVIDDLSEVIGTKIDFLAYGTNTGAAGIDVQAGAKLSLTDSTFAVLTTTGNGGAIRAAANTHVALTRVTATGGGSATNGGFLGAVAGAQVRIVDSTIDKWVGNDGGALHLVQPAVVSISGSSFTANATRDADGRCGNGGAIRVGDSTTAVEITATKFTSNAANDHDNCTGGRGGAIWASKSALDIDSVSSFITNDAEAEGGAIYASASAVDVAATTFTSNVSARDGGALYVTAPPTMFISTSTFTTNKTGSDDDGGAIWVGTAATRVAIASSKFDGNEAFWSSAAGRGGAIYATASDLDVDASTFAKNNAEDDGGSIFIGGATGDVVLTKSTFSTGHSGDDGGCLMIEDASASIKDTTFDLCDADDNGGAVSLDQPAGTVVIASTKVTNSWADSVGGAVEAFNADIDIDLATFENNDATYGGAIFADNTSFVTIDQSDFNLNAATTDGGGVYVAVASSLLVTATDFTGNTAGGLGGALRAWGNSDIDVAGGLFDKNTADGGGAIRVYDGDLIVTMADFTANKATSGDGGAIFSQSFEDDAFNETNYDVLIDNSTFTANTASSDGGAVALQGWGSATVLDCDFTSNVATGYGGAVWMRPDDGTFNAGKWTVDGGLFVKNDAQLGGALLMDGSDSSNESVDVIDSTFASNVADTGGGVWIDRSDDIEVRRDLFCDNWADKADGGGLWVGSNIGGASNPGRVTNNFFVENRAIKGGGAFVSDAQVGVVNNLFLTNKGDSAVEGGGLRADQDASFIENNLVLGTTGGDGARYTGSGTTFAYNGFATNLVNAHNFGGSAPLTPTGTNLAFSSAPSFMAYTAGTPADSKGCLTTDYRWYVSPDLSPAPTTKDAGDPGTAFKDIDTLTSRNDLGPFGGKYADPAWWTDTDKDGHPWVYDCNDGDAKIFPGATETCNGLDDDCDKTKDEGAVAAPWYLDVDSDGYGDAGKSVATCTPGPGYVSKAGDCDDTKSTINPGALEQCSTVGIDDNCNGSKDEATAADAKPWYTDADGDTYGNASTGSAACVQPAGTTDSTKATDCNDAKSTINPGASELCNSIDDDCDTVIDDSPIDQKDWYPDVDKDTHGDASAPATKACTAPSGSVSSKDDCDDKLSTTYTGATEVCNDIDDDCDGTPDDGIATSSWYSDGDGDGYGAGAATIDCGAPGAGWTKQGGDCNDASSAVRPGVSDTCNAIDDDCDTKIDEDATSSTWYEDKDGDKYGTTTSQTACAQPPGFASGKGDCKDTDATIYPGASETCNLVDDDCNGAVDDNVAKVSFYQDLDGDGYGSAVAIVDCKAPAGYVALGGDCDDADKAENPAAVEMCNDSLDKNCDGEDDKGAADATTWYADTDKDGFGDPGSTTKSCDPVTGYVTVGTDCNDKDSKVVDGVTWFGDGDSDGYGDPNDIAKQCVAPPGYLPTGTDCNDNAALIYPGAGERCATIGIDDDCDKLVDDADDKAPVDGATWYTDADNDGFGVATGTRVACSRPGGFSGNSTDCNDKSALFRPGAPEQCDLLDNDCDAIVDENVAFEPWWPDADDDGYGDAASDSVIDCKAPAGYIDNDIDCNDVAGTGAKINPNSPELCATLGVDDDCDGEFDEADATDQKAYYFDEDADGWGVIGDEILACEAPPGHSPEVGDCDDLDDTVSPVDVETCDGVDNDCDGRIDEGLAAQTLYVDVDEDGFGDEATAFVDCRGPADGEASVGGDCDDLDDGVNPEAVEEWYDDVDQDCAGDSDWDQDGDGVDAGSASTDDCDDDDDAIYPGAPDAAGDAIDQDCDGKDGDGGPTEDRPYEEPPLDTSTVDVPGDACGCAPGTRGPVGLLLLALSGLAARRARRVR